jgi:DNA replication and repair protein RecF
LEYDTLHMLNEPDGVRLDSIRMHSFRNYEDAAINTLGNLTIFCGQNAIGKTSILEAIQLVTALKSFRTSQSAQMIHWGMDSADVAAHIIGNGRSLDMELSIEQGRRSYRLNGKGKRIQDLKGILPAVSFCPDDLHLVKGPDSARRTAIDDIGSQLSRNFYAVKSDYEKLLKHKNQALKNESDDFFIDSIDDVLVRVGTQFLSHRMVVIDKMQPFFSDFYRDITGGSEEVSFSYHPCWDDESASGGEIPFVFDKEIVVSKYETMLKAKRERERIRKKSLVGPHADNVSFLIDGHNAMHFASQGQQRTIVLAFKLAESATIQSTLHQKPILLLDDVMSELDEQRRGYFLDFISNDLQTFITTTNMEYFKKEMIGKADVYRLPLV